MAEHTHTKDRPPPAVRAEALESLLTERGLVRSEVLDGFINRFVSDVGPMNGAKVVAKAWVDDDYRQRLLADGTGAVKELGFAGPQGEHIVVVENSDDVHNVVVCTLCSCYPWPVLACRPSGTRTRPTAAAWCASPAPCCGRWASPSKTAWRCGSGTPAPRTGTSCCPGVPKAPRISPRTIWPRS